MKYIVCAAKFCPRHLVSLSTALYIVGRFILKYPDWHWGVIFLSSPLPFYHIFFSFSFFPSFFPSFLFLPSLFLFPHSSFSTSLFVLPFHQFNHEKKKNSRYCFQFHLNHQRFWTVLTFIFCLHFFFCELFDQLLTHSFFFFNSENFYI